MTAGRPRPEVDPVPAGAVRDSVPGSAARSIAANTVWPVALIIACAACWVAQSGAEWLTGALIVLWFVVLDRALGVPARAWMVGIVRWLLPISVLVAAGALLVPRARSGDWISTAVIVEVLVLLVIVALAVWSAAVARAISDAPVIQFPLRQDKWCAIEGEGRALNHHWRAPAQRAALDLVRLGGNGMSHQGLRPDRVGAFFAYGTPVYSPCDGVVVACRDGHDDMRTPGAHPAGNHVVIEIGPQGPQFLLGHFAKGSILVHQGQRVNVGEELARVGNSGNSSEPHLHIHAQLGGKAMRLRFAGRHRRFRRGATITA